LRNVREPGAGHVGERNAIRLPAFLVAQVDHTFAIDVIRAQHAGFDLMREALVDFLDSGHDGEREIKRRHALGIEASAADRGALAGKRRE